MNYKGLDGTQLLVCRRGLKWQCGSVLRQLFKWNL